jgi:hypothetical protein
MVKVYKYQLLLGDYVRYEIGDNIRSGFVISISRTHYTIIDINNSILYFEEIKELEVVSTELSITVIKCIDANNIKITRKLNFSNNYVCNNLCIGLKDFQDSCKYCSIGGNNPKIYLPGDIVNKTYKISSTSFLYDSNKIYQVMNSTTTSASAYKYIFNDLAGSLPKPNYPYVDLSKLGVENILNNPKEYKLSDRIYYRLTPIDGDLKKNPQLVYDSVDIDKYNDIKSNSYFFINPKYSPCQYCIYDENTCNDLGCKLKEFNNKNNIKY